MEPLSTPQLMTLLAETRVLLADDLTQMRALVDLVKTGEHYRSLETHTSMLEDQLVEYTDEIKRRAIEQFDGANKRPWPGVQLKERTVSIISDSDAARKYAIEHAPGYLTVDMKGLAKLGEKLAGTPAALPFVEISKSLAAELASDLSAYLLQPETE